jgi:hypothetical protein
MATYFPLGHGYELITKEKNIMPEGCNLIVMSLPGEKRIWSDFSGKSEIPEMLDLKEIKDKSYFFKDDLNKYFGTWIHHHLKSVAIYKPGQKYPDLHFKLFVDGRSDKGTEFTGYSGLIPFDNFMSDTFTTKNIHSKLKPEVSKEDWLDNKLELYKYSVYPSPEDYKRAFTTPEGVRQLFLDSNQIKDKAKWKKFTPEFLEIFSDIEQNQDTMKALFSNQFLRVSLKDLMEKYPGTYISLACRKIKDLEGHEDKQFENAVDEIYLRRLPYMNNMQQNKMLKEISEIKNFTNIDINMKAPRNAALGIRRKRNTQKELLSKTKRQNGGFKTRKLR